ncbi:hypothetical protein CXB51_022019 [Gossypium anomalum]|uniref:Uncharacterized protein n=1 Tax=Gossypium anomalum TaxID=47600 RepID=A0A8J6CX00_9ROSI|nr:hypothetical protein CXB51_022019 [Gossypium anomalum]
MEKNDVLIQSQVATLKNLENQMGQLATELRNRPGKIQELIDVEDKPIGKNRLAIEIPIPKESESTKTDEENPNLVNSNTLTSSLDVDLPTQKSYPNQPKVPSPPYSQRL